jgi:hypothetical protein
MRDDVVRITVALMYSTVVVAIGRRLPRAASLAAYSTALAALVAVPLLSDTTAQRVDDLLLRTGVGRLLLYLAVMTHLGGFFLTIMLATNQWAVRQQLALGGSGALVVCGVILWIDVKTLDLPDMAAIFYGIRAGHPPPVLWMNIVIGLSIVYISVWGFLEFLRFLRSARHTYEQGVAGGVVVLYALTGIQGLFIIVEAVGHNRGVDMAVVHQVNVLSKICVPAAACCFLIGQFWLWPLWRHRWQILARYVEPELVQLRNDLLNLSAAEAELHLDIHHEAYANRTIVEEVTARCRAAGLSPARTARARMAASLITFQRENVIQDPSYGLVTSWDALVEDAAAEIDQALATTAWEKALRDAYVYQHVYIIMFLVLDRREFREILLIQERPRIQAWHNTVADLIATVMYEHGQSTPRYEAMTRRGRWGTTLARLRLRPVWRQGDAGRGPDLSARDDAGSPEDRRRTTE